MNFHTRKCLLVTMAVTLSLVGGCTSVNKPLNNSNVQLELRKPNTTRSGTFLRMPPPEASSDDAQKMLPATNPASAAIFDNDGYFVGVAISGGGSRSANFAAATMFELQRLGVLQYTDYISAVSGGALVGAYYCAWGDEWNPENVQKKMTHSFASELLMQTILPWNIIGMTFSNLDRSDLLANTLRNNLYTRDGRELTYGDLRPDRPRLLINATDLQSGKPFTFSNETFNTMNSDLSTYPLAYAVAASSSVPVLLHHVTLRDFSTTFQQYRHLVDGGVTDNLGVQTLVNLFESQWDSARENGQPDPYPNGAIFVVIDATTKFNTEIAAHGDIGLLESLKAGAGLSTNVLIQRASSATLAELIVKHAPDAMTTRDLRGEIDKLTNTGYLEIRDKGDHRVKVIHVSLGRLNDITDLPFQGFSESVNNIATYFNIKPEEAYHLYQAARLIVREKFEKELLQIGKDLNAANH